MVTGIDGMASTITKSAETSGQAKLEPFVDNLLRALSTDSIGRTIVKRGVDYVIEVSISLLLAYSSDGTQEQSCMDISGLKRMSCRTRIMNLLVRFLEGGGTRNHAE